VLSERVRLKDKIGRLYFIPRNDISKWVSYASKYSTVMSGKKFPGKPKLPKDSTSMVARFRT